MSHLCPTPIHIQIPSYQHGCDIHFHAAHIKYKSDSTATKTIFCFLDQVHVIKHGISYKNICLSVTLVSEALTVQGIEIYFAPTIERCIWFLGPQFVILNLDVHLK